MKLASGDLDDVATDVFFMVSCQRCPGQVTRGLMGHANVSTTLNVYTQIVGESKRLAIEKVGNEIAWPEHGQFSKDGKNLLM